MSHNQFNQPTEGQPGQSSQYEQGTTGTPGRRTSIGEQGQQYVSGVQGGQTQTSGHGQQPVAGNPIQQQPMGGPNQQGPTGGQAQVSQTGGQAQQSQVGEQTWQPSTGGTQSGTGGLQGQSFPTQNYLREDVRVPIVEMLNRTLADTTVLRTHAKFAHWNVKGMEFYGLHQLFDEIAEVFEEHGDEIGERITALGGQAMGTAGMAASNCSLPPMPTGAVTGPEYVEILADRLAIHDANLYDAIETAQGYGDPDTADLLNEVSRDVTQQLWFLEAHLQTQPVGTFPASGPVAAGAGQGQQF